MRTSDLDYDLPPDLIAATPAEPRDSARLLVIHRTPTPGNPAPGSPAARDFAPQPPLPPGEGRGEGASDHPQPPPHPTPPTHACGLAPTPARIEHRTIRDLPRLGILRPGDLMVVNRTRVLPALFEATRSATGGRVRGLYLATEPATGDDPAPVWQVMLEARGSLQPGERIDLAPHPGTPTPSLGTPTCSGGSGGWDTPPHLTLLAPLGRGAWRARLTSPLPTVALLDRIGRTPLPPYIRKARRAAPGTPTPGSAPGSTPGSSTAAHGFAQPHDHPHPAPHPTPPDNACGLSPTPRDLDAEVTPDDAARYNTVYAREPGSVAAPTAGLHFTPRVLDELDALGVRRAEVVLHVGLGTFEPIRVDDLAQHQMHPEHFHVPAETIALLRETRTRGGRIFVVGTTTIRALESLPQDLDALHAAGQGYTGETRLFIHPGLAALETPRQPHEPLAASRSGPPFPRERVGVRVPPTTPNTPEDQPTSEQTFRGSQDFQGFRFADIVMTNFHLPRSTLLAMIATLPGVGLDNLKAWYALAIAERYRFYSYGDAMLLA